jgi:hypothetical protein
MLGIVAVNNGSLTRRSIRKQGPVPAPENHYRPGAFWKRFALWWHARDLEHACPMTTEVLKQKGRLEEEVAAFLDQGPCSPFIETMAVSFLERLTTDRDPEVLQTAVAELEQFSLPWKAA